MQTASHRSSSASRRRAHLNISRRDTANSARCGIHGRITTRLDTAHRMAAREPTVSSRAEPLQVLQPVDQSLDSAARPTLTTINLHVRSRIERFQLREQSLRACRRSYIRPPRASHRVKQEIDDRDCGHGREYRFNPCRPLHGGECSHDSSTNQVSMHSCDHDLVVACYEADNPSTTRTSTTLELFEQRFEEHGDTPEPLSARLPLYCERAERVRCGVSGNPNAVRIGAMSMCWKGVATGLRYLPIFLLRVSSRPATPLRPHPRLLVDNCRQSFTMQDRLKSRGQTDVLPTKLAVFSSGSHVISSGLSLGKPCLMMGAGVGTTR